MAMNTLDKDTVRFKINEVCEKIAESTKISKTALSQFESSKQVANSKRLTKIYDEFVKLVEAMDAANKASEEIKESTDKYIKEFERVSGED